MSLTSDQCITEVTVTDVTSDQGVTTDLETLSCVMMVPGPGSDQEGGAQQKLVVAFRNKGDPFVI